MPNVTYDIVARDRASGVTDKLAGKFAKLGNTVKAAIVPAAAIAGAAVVGLVGSSIKAASDLSETLNKTNVIFGDNAKAVVKWSQDSARSFGLSRAEALETASSFGNMFQQLGFGGDQAVKMSKNVVKLSADLGSFNNLPTAEVADMISAAFRGEYDSLQRLIPNINAARVEQKALAMTGKESAKELTAAEKAAATLAIVQKDGAAAANDFAETSGGLANSQKILGAVWANIRAELGARFLPIVTKVVQWLGTMLPKAFEFGSRAVRALVAAFKEGDVTSDGFIGVMERIGVVLRTAWLGVRALIAAFKEGDITSNGFVGVMERIGVTVRWAFDFFKAEVIPRLVDFGRWIANNTGLLKAIAVAVTALVVVTKLHTAAMAVQAAGGFVSFLAAYFRGIKIVQVATKAWTALQWLLNVALKANPIGIVITVLFALGAALVAAYKKSETFRRIVQAAWKGIRDAASYAWNNILKPVFERIQGAGDRWRDRFNSVKNAIRNAWEAIRAKAGAAWRWIRDNVIERWQRGFQNVATRFASVRNTIRRVWSAIQTAAHRAWVFLRDKVFGRIVAGLNGIKTAWAGLKAGFEAGIKAVPGLGGLFGGGGKGGRASAFMGAAGRVFPLPPGTYRWGMGPAGHGYDAQDLPTPTGTPVRAPVSGFAQGIDLGNRSYGKYVRLASSQFGRVILAHLSRLFIGSGFVRAGQLVGLSGSTGNSTGPHLHVEPSAILRFAKGGIIPEHVIGVGLRSGRGYEFGERGPEMVTPGTGRGGITVNVYTGVGDPKAIGREVVKAVGSYLVAGGRLPPKWHTA